MKYSDDIPYTNVSQHHYEACLREPAYQAVVSSFTIVSLVLGQPMSARLLWITLSSKHLDVLNCNLALFHLLQYCFFYAQLFILFLNPFIQAALHKFIFVYIQVGDPMQLCFICLERFFAVIYPTYFHLLTKYRCRETCVGVVWMVSLSLGTLVLFNEKIKKVEEVARYLPLYLMGFLSCIMVFTSMKVANVLRNPIVGKESVHPVKRRAFITISVTSAAAMCCYVPVMIMERFKYEDEELYTCKLVPLCIFFLSTASLVHPLFYLYGKGEFSCRRCTK